MKKVYISPELSLINLEDDIITSSPVSGDAAPDMDGGEENGFII